MPAAAIIVVVAVETGVAATVGAAIASTVVAGTVSTAVATAVGAGAISAGITAAQGGSVSDVLKSAVIGGVSAGVGASVGSSVASAVSESAAAAGYTSIASTLGTIAGQTVGGGVQSAITAAAYGKDPVDALIKGGLTAGLTSGVMQAVNLGTSKIDGFNELPTAVQRATKSALAAGALGKDPEKAALNSFLSSASKYVGSQLKDYGNELKTAYDTATTKGTALESNVKRQEEIVSQYTKTADTLNADYAKVQALTKEANDAIAAFESGGKTQELADIANSKVKAANDYIAEYDKKYTNGKATLDSLVTELDGLKATLPTLEKDFNDSKLALEDTTKLFQDQESENAEILASTVQNLEIANAQVQDAVGTPLTEDQIKEFIESGDIATSAANYIDTKTTDVDEARAALESMGYTPTDEEAQQFVGRTADEALQPLISAYVDPRQVLADEARSMFEATYGYTPSDAEINQFIGQREEASTLEDIGAYVDPRQVLADEARTAFESTYGYTPTQDEINQFLGQRDEAQTIQDIGAYVDPRQVLADELAAAAEGESFYYDPADQAFLDQYLGQRDEAATLEAFRQYADPLATSSQEAMDIYKQQYADIVGADPANISDEEVLQFLEEGKNVTEAEYTGQAQEKIAKDIGFENYLDRMYAEETLGEQFPEAGAWNLYKDTSGVLQGINEGINAAGIGGQTDVANVFEPAYEEPVTPPEEQTYQEIPTGVDEFDLASYFPDMYETTTTPLTQPVIEEPTPDITQLLGELAPQTAEATQAETEAAQPDLTAQTISDYYRQSTIPSEGVQLASYSPLGTMTDSGDLTGLLSRTKPTTPLVTEAEPLVTEPEAESATDLTAATPGSATYSALTGTDPTKTITSGILGEDTGDVRGGIESSALYSGTEEELTPSDLLTSKYFTETPETKALEDIGLTGTEQPVALASNATAPITSDALIRSDETTLPTSSEASQTATALKGTIMDDTYDEYAGYPEGGFYGLPEGAEPETIISEPEGQPQLLNDVVTIGSDIYRINPDGSAVGTNTETGEQFNVTAAQLQAMLGDQGFGPGEAGDLRGTPYTYKPGTFGGQGVGTRIANAITNQFQKDPLKFLTALGGAAAGAASTRKGITPRGLQSLQGLQGIAGGGAGRYQTGAVGTKGRGGVRYFERRAEGGPIGYAQGGLGYLKTAHDGMADQIDATIDNKRPAKLSGGEFVIPADVVSHLGNGNSEAGAKQLYDLMERVRQARTGTPKQGKQINPKKYLPK